MLYLYLRHKHLLVRIIYKCSRDTRFVGMPEFPFIIRYTKQVDSIQETQPLN